MQEYSVATAALTQLFVQSPVLLVYIVGLCLAPALLSRFPTARNLVMLGSALMLITSVLSTFTFQYLIQLRTTQAWSMTQFGTISGAVGIVGSIAHAIGLGLILAAAFNGRPREPMVAASNYPPQR